MEPLRIYLFGGFLLERGSVALPPIASRAGRSLFAHLVMNRDRPLQRDLLAGTFWPELPEGRARRRLSHTLWQIQDVVNTERTNPLVTTGDSLSFDVNTPFWLDVDAFDEAYESDETGPAREARLRTCVELYRGDFMAGYFDDWVLVDQDLYRLRYLSALRKLVDATKANGAYEEALAFARRLTHHDPLNEEGHQEVMRLSFLLGRTTDAIEQFERCRSVLAEELGAKPSAPTVELYEKVLRQRRSGVRALREEEKTVMIGRRTDSPFVGREQERRVLVDSFERVLAGSGGVVLVEGEPGVGKTRMTLEAAEDARWRGFEVSWGSCRPGALRPFAPIIEVLESLTPLRVEQLTDQVAPVWLSEVARLAPSLQEKLPKSGAPQLRPAEESTRMIEALVNSLSALGRITPHMIVIDDVHWADQDTLSVLAQVGKRLAESRVLLLLLYRSEEARGDARVWDVLRDLDRSSGLGRVVLSPLSVFELDEMVRRTLGIHRLDPSLAARLHRQTGGNVLFTIETLLAIRDQGLFESGADPAATLEHQVGDDHLPVAPRVRTVIASRMALLGEDVAAVYELAAVCGDTIDLGLIEEATELPRAKVLQAIDELLYRGLLSDLGSGTYRITHDQVRQVVYESTDPERRQHLHRRIADALVASDPGNVEEIGHHYRQAGDPGQASSYLALAGLRAIELNAYETARAHLEESYETGVASDLTDAQAYTLLGHLSDVLDVLGERDEQRKVIAEMEVRARHLTGLHGDLYRRRAWLLAQLGEMHEAEESALLSVEMERSGQTAALALALISLGTIRRWSGRPLDAVAPLTEAAEIAANEATRASALTELASTLVEVQQPTEALEYLDIAGAIYSELDDLRGRAEVAGIEARTLHQEGQRDKAASAYETAIDLCRNIGYRHGEGVNLTNLANLRQLLGAVADAISGYDEAARIFSDLGNRRGQAMVLANSASARHHLLGEDRRARTDAISAMALFSEIGDKAREAQCQEILAGIEARRGDPDEARRLLETSLPSLAGTGNAVLEGQHLRSLASLDIEMGHLDEALSVLDRAESLAEKADLDGLRVDLTSLRALALLSGGKRSEALRLARNAVEAIGPGVERSYLIHYRLGFIAEANGDLDTARIAYQEADRLLQKSLEGLDGPSLDQAMAMVPEHRSISNAAERFAPTVVEVSLPLIDAPSGKPLVEEDLRTVSWTVDQPSDHAIASEIQRRRARILRLVTEARQAGTAPTTEHLAEVLRVSSSTVRRDLGVLRSEGHDVATRGRGKAS